MNNLIGQPFSKLFKEPKNYRDTTKKERYDRFFFILSLKRLQKNDDEPHVRVPGIKMKLKQICIILVSSLCKPNVRFCRIMTFLYDGLAIFSVAITASWRLPTQFEENRNQVKVSL